MADTQQVDAGSVKWIALIPKIPPLVTRQEFNYLSDTEAAEEIVAAKKQRELVLGTIADIGFVA